MRLTISDSKRNRPYPNVVVIDYRRPSSNVSDHLQTPSTTPNAVDHLPTPSVIEF
ncbi:hypothetical protein Csa_016357, partial [Cucumis sativus]